MKSLPRLGLRAALATLLVMGALVPAAAQDVGLPVGTQAPAAALEDLDGNAVQLLDYTRGKPALLEFWATWCDNCETLQPQMDQIHAKYGDRLQVVAVAVAVSQTVRRVKRHLEDHPSGYPFLWDAQGAAVRAYKAPTTSVVVLLDADGRVVYTGSGGGQDLLAAVAKVLG